MHVQPLQPLSIGQMLDRAIRLYRGNLLTFLGIVALVQVPAVALQIIVSSFFFTAAFDDPLILMENVQQPRFWIGLLVSVVVAVVLGFLSYLSLGALARAVGLHYLGERVGIAAAYEAIGHSWATIIGMVFFSFILAIVIFFGSLVTIVGICSLVGMSVLLQFATQMAIPIIVLERRGAVDSLRRAWSLMRRRFWPVLGYLLLLLVLEYVAVAGPSAVVSLVFNLVLGGPVAAGSTPFIAQTVVGGALSIFYLPFSYAAIVLLYFDLRVRTEGLDLDLQADALAEQPSSISALLSRAPAVAVERLLTMEEYFMFVGASVVALLVLFFAQGALALIAALGTLSGG